MPTAQQRRYGCGSCSSKHLWGHCNEGHEDEGDDQYRRKGEQASGTPCATSGWRLLWGDSVTRCGFLCLHGLKYHFGLLLRRGGDILSGRCAAWHKGRQLFEEIRFWKLFTPYVVILNHDIE